MAKLEEIVADLQVGQEKDITGLFPTGSDVLIYKDGPAGKPDICLTQVTLKKEKSLVGPVTIFNIYENDQLVMSEFFYEDQTDELFDTIQKWTSL